MRAFRRTFHGTTRQQGGIWSPEPHADKDARTQSGSPKKARTSLRSTSAPSSAPPSTRGATIPEDLEETARFVEKTGAATSIVDVRDPKGLEQAVKDGSPKFGRPDTVVANAGIFSSAPLHETHRDAVERDGRHQPHWRGKTMRPPFPT